MPECYIGRGKLYARKLSEPLAGFIPVTGESEVTLSLTEEVGDVKDGRYGRMERTDWFIKSIQATLEASVFDLSASQLEMLLKGTNAIVVADAARAYIFPLGLAALALYPIDRANILPGAVIADSLLAPLIEGTHYKLDAKMGLVEFLDLTGFTEPLTITYDNAIYDELGIATTNTIALELMFRGINKKSSKAIMAVFYHAELRIAEAMRLISKEFASLPFKVELIADFSHNVDDVLSHYGKVTQI